MAELMWLEAGAGGQQWLELWEQARPSHNTVPAVTARLYCFMGCLGSVVLPVFLGEELRTVLKQTSSEAEPRTGLMGGPSLPQKHLFHDLSLLMFAAMGQSPAALLALFARCPGGRSSSPCGSAVSSGPGPPAGVPVCRRAMAQVRWHWQELPVLGSLSFCLQCLFLASGSL